MVIHGTTVGFSSANLLDCLTSQLTVPFVQASKNLYIRFSIIQTPIIRMLHYPNAPLYECLDVALFSAQWEKDVVVHVHVHVYTGVLLQEKSKLLYEKVFPDAAMLFFQYRPS